MIFYTDKIWKTKNVVSYTLKPISFLYQIITTIKISFSKPKKVSIPVISVGNLTVGGTGKTPITRYLVKTFQSHGIKTATILRGYGGRIKTTTKVNQKLHNSIDVGDEALLHARDGNVWVSPNRYVAAIEAINLGAEIILLDDAHQNYSLKKDFSIIVVDSEEVFGNEEIIPSGPLRENIDKGIKKADAIVICGDKKEIHKKIGLSKKPIFYVKMLPGIEIKKYTNKKANAFCAIGNPKRFFNMLIKNKIQLKQKFIFRNHHQFTKKNINKILEKSKNINAITLTTEKDFVRIDKELKNKIIPLTIETHWEDDSLFKLINEKLFRRQSR